MITRRTLLAGAAAAAATPVLALTPRAEAATVLPLTVVNHTYRYANSAIFLYVVGTDLSTGQQVYVRADGTRVPVSASLNGPDGFADLSIPLAANGDTHLNLPWMSGRIYVSIGQKVKFRVVTDGNGRPALQHPAGWVSSDPSYGVLHDFMEFTFKSDGMFCNTTMVDMFSIPMELRLDGQSSHTVGTLVPNGRDTIFAGIAANPAFRPLIVGDNLRVIAPGHGIDSGIFSSTYFDPYVTQVWNTYASANLRVVVGGTTYTGRVSGGQLVFNNGIRTFARPSTRDIFYCNGALDAGGTSGPVAAILGAAFNRSTLHNHPDQPTTDRSTFYLTSVSNHYARVLHENTRDHKAYGFPFDDVANFASYVQDLAPTSLRLRLTPFNATA
ncbi:beta-1,3-glucanase family protein [Nonomuraea sp. NPDC049141]|uniref:beta-1,3-glucanase family protein n=1 Tax=Nonomuraea sp. NPDC049141 TaxID=3155500 RepID=UPI0033D6A2C5